MGHIKFINDHGRNIPEEVSLLVKALREIKGVENVGYGEFIMKNNPRRPEIENKGYDERNKTLKIRINRQNYNQTIFVKTYPADLEMVIRFTENYFSH